MLVRRIHEPLFFCHSIDTAQWSSLWHLLEARSLQCHTLSRVTASTPASNASQRIAAFTPHPPKAPAAETKPAAPLADAPAAAEPAAQKEAATETASAETSKTAPAEAAAPETPRAEAKNSGNGSMDFTEEQDRQLLGLKGAGQSWKYIAMTLDKSVGDVKHRYHHIKPKDEAGNSKEPMNDNAAKATEANAKGLAAKAAKEEEKKAKAKAGQEAAQAQAQAQGAAAQNQMPGAYPVNQYVMMEDEFFSFSDVRTTRFR